MSGPKILITGSGGFVFSNFVRQTHKNSNYSIVSIDKCIQPNVLNTFYANKGCPLHIGDVADPHFIDIIFQVEKPDYVIHGAVEENNIKTNILGTQIVINACLKYKIKKLIYISSYNVYGSINDGLWDERSPINPSSPFAANKASAELLVKTSGVDYNIVRPCNNFGPRQQKTKLIPTIIGNISHNIEVPIYDQGMQIRDWIHVQDNCNAILTVLEKAPVGEIYNISAKQEFTNIEIFQRICNIWKKGYDLISFIPNKPKDFRRAISNDKIKELGWRPSFSFNDGMEHTIKWYDRNQWFLRG